MLQQTTQTLLTPQVLGTLAGSVTAVFVMTQGLRYCFGWSARYIGLLLSLLVSFFTAAISGDQTIASWGLALPNAFLIFASATGTASMTGRRNSNTRGGRTKKGPEEVVIRDSRRFWGSWF